MVLLAVLGMPGSGKSFATNFFVSHGFERVYFGGIVIEETKKRGLGVNEANEKKVREGLRKKHGMAAMAVLSIPKIRELLGKGKNVVVDGLYSWPELLVLKKEFPELKVLAIVASPKTRHERLGKRKQRPLTKEECTARDKAEIENLEKGAPIAMADFSIVNEATIEEFEKELGKIIAVLA